MASELPNVRGLQEAARREMEEKAAFVREDGTAVEPDEVPEDTRRQLEQARLSVLRRIAEDEDAAERLHRAVEREDPDAASKVLQETPGLPREMRLHVLEARANFRCSCHGCLFGFCCSCTFQW